MESISITLAPASVITDSVIHLAVPRQVSGIWLVDTNQDAIANPANSVWYFVRIDSICILTDKERFYLTNRIFGRNQSVYEVMEGGTIDKVVVETILQMIAKFDRRA